MQKTYRKDGAWGPGIALYAYIYSRESQKPIYTYVIYGPGK